MYNDYARGVWNETTLPPSPSKMYESILVTHTEFLILVQLHQDII